MSANLAFIGCLVLSAGAFAQAPQYTITDLGSLPNLPACTATAISQSGDVTGYCVGQEGVSLLNNPPTHVFLYSKGKLTDLNITGQQTPVPMAINDSDVVAGGFLTINVNQSGANFVSNPFVRQANGTVTQPQGPMQSVLPFALTNSGQLAGTRILVTSSSKANVFLNSQAVLYLVADGTTTLYNAPAGAGASAAFAINQNGTVAGASVGQNNSSAFRPLLWQNSVPQTLPMLSGFQQAVVSGVNDSGVATGYGFNFNFNSFLDLSAGAHAVLFNKDGSLTDLGVLSGDRASLAAGINNAGTVIGFSTSSAPTFALHLDAIFENPKGTSRAFVYTGGKMYDLATLVTNNGTGWRLSNATGINNAGQITGTGLVQGPDGTEQHGFLLTPAAAPAGPAITGIGGAGGSVPAVTSLSANGLFTIYGSDFTTTPAGINSGNILNNELPTNLGGVCVESNGTKWGLFFVSAGQINALAGTLPASGTVPVTVVTNCGTGTEVSSPVMNVPVAAVAPEFLYFLQHADGTNPIAAADFTTGTLAGAAGLIPGATFAPVHANDVVIAYGVGWGTTSSTDPIGTLATAAASLPAGSYSLTVGGLPANVSYAGLSPGSAGLYQINFTVPSGLTAEDQKVVLKIAGVSTSANAFITVGN